VFNGDTTKTAKIKRCYYFWSTSP